MLSVRAAMDMGNARDAFHLLSLGHRFACERHIIKWERRATKALGMVQK